MATLQATAAPLARALGREPVVVDGLREYDAEARHYLPVREMARHDPAGWRTQPDPDGMKRISLYVTATLTRRAAASALD